ncbi:hypothetical protein L210DRAFT_948705 [Boletus edulis BED1]|uniref:Uncharacterized protein n=1 Tax=Boletus edulis BED1 TaxID=1328754 RepID=A0AAD4GGU4_BOLED|nr:hypothetical protein L210DRAFT_948705 [Boletus edulis BED1]
MDPDVGPINAPRARIQLLSQKQHGCKTTTYTFQLGCDHKNDDPTIVQENEMLVMLRSVVGD